MFLFWQKIGWTAFWATFSRTHLVTLGKTAVTGKDEASLKVCRPVRIFPCLQIPSKSFDNNSILVHFEESTI
jgi:hypothetical protein